MGWNFIYTSTHGFHLLRLFSSGFTGKYNNFCRHNAFGCYGSYCPIYHFIAVVYWFWAKKRTAVEKAWEIFYHNRNPYFYFRRIDRNFLCQQTPLFWFSRKAEHRYIAGLDIRFIAQHFKKDTKMKHLIAPLLIFHFSVNFTASGQEKDSPKTESSLKYYGNVFQQHHNFFQIMYSILQ